MSITKINTDYNIEYAHIYVNETPSREHFDSGWIAKRKEKELSEQGKTVLSVILIDEYNPKERLLDENALLEHLGKQDVAPDFLAYESQLVPHAPILLESIRNPRWREFNQKKIAEGDVVPCSLLVAVWYLFRLGIFKINGDLLKPVNDAKIEDFPAKNIITVLPNRYRSVEEKALNFIAASNYREVSDRIEHIYY